MAQEIPVFRFCEVESVDDSTGCNRIKVRLQPEDGNIPVDQLPFVIPLLPQIFHVKPKVGEGVLVVNAIATNAESQRYYIGPVISQLSHLPNEPISDAKKEFVGKEEGKKLDPNPSMDVNKTSGALPKEEDVAVCGRKFSDIILSDNDLKIRCGVKNVSTVNEREFSFNGATSSFIKLKYYPHGLENVENCNSTVTVVADKINLIGNNSKNSNYKPSVTPDELISDEEMEELIQSAHVLPYGDRLVTFLSMFRKAFLKHTHPFPMLPPCAEGTYKSVQNYRLDRLLSDSVRIG